MAGPGLARGSPVWGPASHRVSEGLAHVQVFLGQVWAGARDSAFLTSFPGMLVLGPHCWAARCGPQKLMGFS